MTFPLNGVRVLDFTWLNAGAKGTRHLALYGADVIHIEWKGRLDLLRHNPPYHEVPGDASMPKAAPGYDHLKVSSVNRAASFNNNHVGKWGISLNLRHPKGKAIFRDLVKTADVVADNFTASTLDGWGFGPEALEQIKPDIIYVQAPGFGRLGPYSDYRSYGPTAAAISGLTWQGGLPDRYPCGYGFSYMDVCGPYFLAMAVLSALRQRNRTGRGVYVDSSQCGPAFLLTGPALLEWSANGDGYVRNGNRSTYVAAAPHNAYRCKGKDDWVVITCFTDEHWRGLVNEMGNPAWTARAEFATVEGRFERQDELDPLVEAWTSGQDRYDVMRRLQAAGVPAAVCQNTADRYERDPQLRHRGYFSRVPHSEVPPYDTEGHPGLFSDTQPSPLGRSGRGSAMYGEDNARIYGELLGLSTADVEALRAEDVI